MKLYGAGNVILYFREKYRLNQSRVCEGICSEMTLSRIEMGEREFESMISETLLSRLGKSADRFEFVLNEDDYHLCELREKIENCIKKHDKADAGRYIAEYEKGCPKEQKLHQQYLLYCRAMLMDMEGGRRKEAVELLHRAIDLTRPDYRENKRMLFSRLELKIIYQLFLYENYEEREIQSLFDFVERMYETEESAKIMVPFLERLVRRYEEQKNYQEMERVADWAIKCILEGRGYHCLADFTFARIRAREQLCDKNTDWEKHRKKLVEACMNVYYMYMIEDEIQKMEETAKFCEERLQWRITERVI